MLRENRGADVRVFVIWEPVLLTDWFTPSTTLTTNVPDGRAAHFWDPERSLSKALGGAPNLDHLAVVRNVGFRMKDVVWDAGLLYPAGVKWGSPAQLLAAPVVEYREQLAKALSEVGR